MKTLLLIFALSLCAAAQTMVGMPEYGVDLSGNAVYPLVTNHSGQRIILIARRFDLADGGHTGGATLFMHSVGFAPASSQILSGLSVVGDEAKNATMATPGGLPPGSLQGWVKSPVVKVSIDSVLFEDSHFVGPDTDKNFDGITSMIKTYRELGRSLINGTRTWEDISVLSQHGQRPPQNEDSLHLQMRWAARNLINEKVSSGESVAFELARRHSQMADPWK